MPLKKLEHPHAYEIYLPEAPGPFPLICITPLLGRLRLLEDLYFEKKFARYFAKHGFAAAVLGRPIFEYNFQAGDRKSVV